MEIVYEYLLTKLMRILERSKQFLALQAPQLPQPEDIPLLIHTLDNFGMIHSVEECMYGMIIFG
jgi:hypothetical protein